MNGLAIVGMIVGELHIGESDEDVCGAVVAKLKRGSFERLDNATRALVLHTAVAIHAENRKVYREVMGWY